MVPEIKRSAAYKDGGLIAITFDQAPQTGPHADPSACCSSPTSYPNLRRLTTAAGGARRRRWGWHSLDDPTARRPRPRPTGHHRDDRPTRAPDDYHDHDADRRTTGSTTTTTPATTTPATSLGDGETTPTGGGGQVGLLLISRYVKANSIDVVDYFNHFSLLASIENLFGLHRLGYAGMLGLPAFSLGVFNAYAG